MKETVPRMTARPATMGAQMTTPLTVQITLIVWIMNVKILEVHKNALIT
jgi:hypothetical protein